MKVLIIDDDNNKISDIMYSLLTYMGVNSQFVELASRELMKKRKNYKGMSSLLAAKGVRVIALEGSEKQEFAKGLSKRENGDCDLYIMDWHMKIHGISGLREHRQVVAGVELVQEFEWLQKKLLVYCTKYFGNSSGARMDKSYQKHADEDRNDKELNGLKDNYSKVAFNNCYGRKSACKELREHVLLPFFERTIKQSSYSELINIRAEVKKCQEAQDDENYSNVNSLLEKEVTSNGRQYKLQALLLAFWEKPSASYGDLVTLIDYKDVLEKIHEIKPVLPANTEMLYRIMTSLHGIGHREAGVELGDSCENDLLFKISINKLLSKDHNVINNVKEVLESNPVSTVLQKYSHRVFWNQYSQKYEVVQKVEAKQGNNKEGEKRELLSQELHLDQGEGIMPQSGQEGGKIFQFYMEPDVLKSMQVYMAKLVGVNEFREYFHVIARPEVPIGESYDYDGQKWFFSLEEGYWCLITKPSTSCNTYDNKVKSRNTRPSVFDNFISPTHGNLHLSLNHFYIDKNGNVIEITDMGDQNVSKDDFSWVSKENEEVAYIIKAFGLREDQKPV